MGVSMYRLLTAKWPVEAATAAGMEPLVLAGAHEPLRDAAPHLSRRLTARVERSMAVDPDNRYQSWRQMHDDLGWPGVVANVWRRIQPHSSHEACWVELRRATGSLHQICVSPDSATTVQIETRRAGGAMTRVVEHCHTNVPRSRLPVLLRRALDKV